MKYIKLKHIIVLILLSIALFSCNWGQKSTSCPSHNPNWAKNGKTQKYYKH